MFSCVIKPFEGIEAVLKAFLIVRASTSPCAAISSIMACKDKALVLPQPVVYMIGQEENGVFCAQTPMRDLDRGLDFYAPQT